MSADKKLPAGKSSSSDIDSFLRNVSALAPSRPATGERGRLIFALDATASREPSWDRACHLQAEMFRETAALGGLDVQLVYYRGFGEFKASEWCSESESLLHRMTRVYCLGGQTQTGKVLRHAVTETKKKKVSAVVFVGDAFEEDIDKVCVQAGEMGMLGVPAFMFHEGRDPIAERSFKQIAKLTKGAYCSFDAASAQQLRELLRAVAVFAAGGRRALADYSKRHGGGAAKLAAELKALPNQTGPRPRR
jgi:hypothetical protein